MKNLIILFNILLVLLMVSSCETQTVNDEQGIGIEDNFGTNKGDAESPGSGGDEPIEQ